MLLKYEDCVHPQTLGLKENKHGAGAIEFALLLPIFMLVFLGVFEFCLYNYARVIIQRVTSDAGRSVLIGHSDLNGDRVSTFIDLVRARSYSLIDPAQFHITAAKLTQGGTIATDLCLNLGVNVPPTTGTTCPPDASGNIVFVEVNGIVGYQGNGGIDLGVGGELVELRITYPWRLIFPIFTNIVGENGIIAITTISIVKNEPF